MVRITMTSATADAGFDSQNKRVYHRYRNQQQTRQTSLTGFTDSNAEVDADLERSPPEKVLVSSWCRRSFQILAVVLYLITWVANGEVMQHITTTVYNKPAAITWFSFNFMTLSFPLALCIKWNCHGTTVAADGIIKRSNAVNSFALQLRQLIQEWAGHLGIKHGILICVAISYSLLALNVFMLLGLECISLSLTFAIFQLETPLTIVLSVFWLKDRFLLIQGTGMILSMVGVATIVMPALDHKDACLKGVAEIVAASAIGAFYLTTWRWLETKNKLELSPREGLVDAHMTLSMIGFCNLLAGWPILVLLHYLQIEVFEWPSSREVWTWMFVNGIVEYLFDASCAMAIFATSPIVVSVTAPLTIPVSILLEQSLRSHGFMVPPGMHLYVGGIMVLIGTVLIEGRPSFDNFLLGKKRSGNGSTKVKREKETELEELIVV
jgi:hypothetical protein